MRGVFVDVVAAGRGQAGRRLDSHGPQGRRNGPSAACIRASTPAAAGRVGSTGHWRARAAGLPTAPRKTKPRVPRSFSLFYAGMRDNPDRALYPCPARFAACMSPMSPTAEALGPLRAPPRAGWARLALIGPWTRRALGLTTTTRARGQRKLAGTTLETSFLRHC